MDPRRRLRLRQRHPGRSLVPSDRRPHRGSRRIPGAFHGFDAVAPATTITGDLRRDVLHAIHTVAGTPPSR
nr:hypothetical protein [Nocardia farcinica]